jgi:hypothetical protein
MTLAAAVTLLALAAPPAGPVADLAAALARLPATTPVRARVEHRFAFTAGDDKPRPDGVIEALVAAGPDGLQVTWGPGVLKEADQEEQRRAADPEARTPVRDTLADLRPLALARALDATPELLRALQQSELLESRAEAKDGAPATLLTLKVTPVLGTRDRRYVKEVTATLRLWLGADGLPVAAEQLVQAKGRAFIVISFESEQLESFRFTRVGDRLVVVRAETDQRSEGAGDKSHRHSVTTVTLVP